jgi:putative ABC transport system ATP-binding protein
MVEGGVNFLSLLIASNLKKTYVIGTHPINAVDNVSLSIRKGEFISIIGASGSGKSTLLHLLGGVDRPSSGSVFINDIDIFEMHDDNLTIFRRKNIGIIYQFVRHVPDNRETTG